MVRLKAKLTRSSLVDLSMAARALNTSREVAFEYVVRNTLRAYHPFDQGGYANMLDEVGNVYVLNLTKGDEAPPLATKLISIVRRRSHQAPRAIKWEMVETEVSESTHKDIQLSMSVYGLDYTTFINRLVVVGSVLAVFLKEEGHQAFAYNSKNQALGKIEFT